MPAPRSAAIAFAAVLAASSSLVMLQSARPALADQDDHRYAHHQRWDRDDRHRHGNTYVNQGGWNNAGHWNNGRRWANNGNTYWNTNGGYWNTSHPRRADRDDRHRRDRDHDRR